MGKFTRAVREAYRLSNDYALQMGATKLAPEHLLLGLAHQENEKANKLTYAQKALATFAIAPYAIDSLVYEYVDRKNRIENYDGHLVASDLMRAVLQKVEQVGMRNSYYGWKELNTGFFLHGLYLQKDSITHRVLAELGYNEDLASGIFLSEEVEGVFEPVEFIRDTNQPKEPKEWVDTLRYVIDPSVESGRIIAFGGFDNV